MTMLVAKSNLRYWLQHRWQLLLMVTGLALGVAVVFAVDIANESAKRAFALSVDAVSGRTTHQLVSFSDSIDENIYTQLRVDMGVRNSAPIVEGSVVINGEVLQVLGVDLFAETVVRSVSFARSNAVGSSRAALDLLQPGAVILSASTAQRFKRSVGEQLRSDGGAEFKLVNTIVGQQEAAFESIIMMDIATAQDLLQMQGKLSRIDLVIKEDSTLTQIKNAFPSTNVIDAVTRNTALKQMTSAFHTNLLAMSLLGVLVGAFLIYNTVTIAVLQRRSLFGVLRATGVTRDELFRSVLFESLIIACVGTLIGLLVGYLLGFVLLELVTRTINDLYFSLNVKRVDFGAGTVAKAVALGLGSALIATIAPALEASRSAPVTVLQSSAIERRASRIIPMIAVAGVVLVVVGLMITWFSERSLWAGFIALMCIVIGYSLLIPIVLQTLTSHTHHVFSRFSGNTLIQYAVRSLSSSISRTSVAIAALVIAVSATAGVGIMIGSFRLSVDNWLGQTLQSDVYISAESEDSATTALPEALVKELGALPEVSAMRLARFGEVETETGPLNLLAVQLSSNHESGFTFLRTTANYETEFEQGEGVFISEPYAWEQQLEPGDTITLYSDNGKRSSVVSAIITDYGASNGLVIMALPYYRTHWNDDQLSSVGLHLVENTSVSDVKDTVRRLANNHSVPLLLRSNVEIRERSLQIFDRTFAITHILRILTIGVAFVGILSALLALALERASEFAVLRAIGLTPYELGKLTIVQCALMGLIAGVLALPLGFIMSKMLIDVINQRSFGWTMGFYVPPGILLQTLLLALIAAVLAGWYPSRKLSRMSPAEALREN